MDNNLLKQLIEQHRRVVIPDFGAFLKKETPEGEELVFSPFLRKDDGVVTDAIVREYGVETEDARAMVAEFVIYLKRSLTASGKYYIEGVGMLAADANGAVTLREGEVPEPEPVAATPVEPVPVRPAQTVVTRPQSIQVQSVPQPTPPPVAQTVVQNYPQQQPMAQPQPQQQAMRPPMPQQQPFGQSYPQQQPMAQPQQQAMRPPMPQQQPQPQAMRPPMPYPQQQPMPYPQQQPMPQPQQQAMRPPMPPSMSQSAMGMQNQTPMVPPMQQAPQQSSAQPQQPQQRRPNAPGGPNGPGKPGQPGAGGPQQPGRRPQPPRRNRAPKTKADVWLIVAIVAALVVIAIMVYGFINTDRGDIDMDAINAAMAPVADTTVVVDDPAAGL